MLSDFQKKKLSNNFKLIDVNHDGLLTRDDFYNHGAAYADLIKVPQKEFINKEIEWWDKMNECLALSQERPITREEYFKAFDNVLTNSCYFPIFLWDYMILIWSSLSLKKEDFLSYENFIGVMFSDKEKEAKEIFTLLDTEKKGALTIHELYGYWFNFFYSNNQECPSKWVFGKFD